MEKLPEIDYIVTSPPYHNILKNKGAGLRAKKTNGYRTGSRQGVEYYSEKEIAYPYKPTDPPWPCNYPVEPVQAAFHEHWRGLFNLP